MKLFHFNILLAITILLTTTIEAKRKGNSTTSAQKSDKFCPESLECPFNAQSCTEDDDCNFDSICCESSCGKVCRKHLNTGCRTMRRAESRRAKALGVDKKSVRLPRCSKDGAFEPIQCNNEIVSSCWCVDEAGFELPGTRAPAAALVNCTVPKPCAAHTCRMFCTHGFTLDKNGCPLCKCRDPCEDIQCPDALSCQLEDVACKDPPCPPIPTCKRGRSLENLCPVGDPLRISDTVRPFLCGNEPTKPSCPPLYQCLVQGNNDYGVCCPASLQIQKAGSCPLGPGADSCGIMCTHDLECPGVQKCCNNEQCGSSCVHPMNVTECLYQKSLSEMLSVSERIGRGYIPQCKSDGQFEPKQCSRNGLVCWCVDHMGRKLKGSMGAAENVDCSVFDARLQATGRSLSANGKDCEKLECAAVCEYGFAHDQNGCPTCKCDDPCDGYKCAEDEECVPFKESTCTDFLCPTLPICRPKQVYSNPCKKGTPLNDDLTGSSIFCDLGTTDGIVCPGLYQCTAVAGSTQSVCCPKDDPSIDTTASESTMTQLSVALEQPQQTMCEYLHSFSDSMEGTREGMTLALPQPQCDNEGRYTAVQCDRSTTDCWCVDHYGVEIPKTRGSGNPLKNCTEIWETSECLDLTCRMGCDYGFILDEDTGCPTCECRDPCTSVACTPGEQCQLVEVSCQDHYCPPVPACLPKKAGQCPYLIPPAVNCEYACNSDLACNGTSKCCSNGCGTQCVEPLLLTACQHARTVAEHRAHESGTPAGKIFMPNCNAITGEYEPKQCNPQSGECWCVDFHGFEISQTRTPKGKLLNCDQPYGRASCPLYKCVKGCEHGYKLDANGCRTCECLDPCKNYQCLEENETCRLVSVECVSAPCPRVPMCLPQKENPCQTGSPLRMGNEQVSCGPDYDSCPSSHKCQLSPIGEYSVCCPKPRHVCFEPLDQGTCEDEMEERNLTRFYFNVAKNQCEQFPYKGCQGNHNNFHSVDICNSVCPVLSQCERLRERNLINLKRYNKTTFIPRCNPDTGNWDNVQCFAIKEHSDVCWCVNPQGEPLKSTLTRGKEPECNYRQARNRARSRMDGDQDADNLLEELLMQLNTFEEEEEENRPISVIDWELPLRTRCEALGAQCDRNGKFLPAQCDEEYCWCVDEAGNQLPNTSTFQKGEHICMPTPVEKVDVTIGFRGEYDPISALPVNNQMLKIVKNMQGLLTQEGINSQISPDTLYVSFSLIGSKKVDVAYRLEQMVLQQRIPGLTADITRSKFVHKLSPSEPTMAERVVALEHREIVSQSPVRLAAQYQTAIIVMASASTFVISVLLLLVLLYRKKMAVLNRQSEKIVEDNQRFLSLNRPIYIEVPDRKKVTADA